MPAVRENRVMMMDFPGDFDAARAVRPASYRLCGQSAERADWHNCGTFDCANQIRSRKGMMRKALRSDVPSVRSWRVSPKPVQLAIKPETDSNALKACPQGVPTARLQAKTDYRGRVRQARASPRCVSASGFGAHDTLSTIERRPCERRRTVARAWSTHINDTECIPIECIFRAAHNFKKCPSDSPLRLMGAWLVATGRLQHEIRELPTMDRSFCGASRRK